MEQANERPPGRPGSRQSKPSRFLPQLDEKAPVGRAEAFGFDAHTGCEEQAARRARPKRRGVLRGREDISGALFLPCGGLGGLRYWLRVILRRRRRADQGGPM